MIPTVKITFRKPGRTQWSEDVDWPEAVRIPVAGEIVELPQHGQVTVEAVQRWADAESRDLNGGIPAVQLVVR